MKIKLKIVLSGVIAAFIFLAVIPFFNINAPFNTQAVAVEADNGFYYTVENGEATLSGIADAEGHVIIPSALGGYPVTAIGERAFDSLAQLEGVTMPSTVTAIEKEAFYMCAALESVTIPSSVKVVGNGAFQKCSALKKVTFGAGTEQIGDYAFDDCFSLESVTFSKGLKKIGSYAFRGCSALTGISLPSGLTEIGAYAFLNCIAFKSITLPDSVSVIGDYAFRGCTGLTSAALPLNTKIIEDGLFLECVSLKTVSLGKNVTEIRTDAFVSCENLRSIIIPDSVLYIRKCAFGYNRDIYGDYSKIDNFTVYGKPDSVTQSYCENNGLIFFSSFTVGKPKEISAVQNTSAIKLTWSKANNADGYRIYYKNNGKWQAVVKATTATSYTFSKLPAGKKYVFAVKAYAQRFDNVIWSQQYITLETSTKALAPVTVKAESSSSALRITWNKCEGADGYRIYVKTKNGWDIAASSVTNVSHTFKGLNAGSKYTLAVRPYIKVSGKVIWSDYKTVFAATKPSAPEKIKAQQNASAVKLTWSEVRGATGYAVYRQTDSTWKYIGATQKTTGTVKKLSEATKYTFAVRSFIKQDSTVIWGDYKVITTATSMNAVKVKAISDVSSIVLSWQSKKGAEGYRIYYKTSLNGKWKIAVSSTKNTQAVFNKLISGKKYTIVVRPYIKTPSGVVWGSYSENAVTTKVNSGGSLAVTYSGLRLYNITSTEAAEIYKNWRTEDVTYYECKNYAGEVLLYAKYGTVWRGIDATGAWYDDEGVMEVCSTCGKIAGYGKGQCSGKCS